MDCQSLPIHLGESGFSFDFLLRGCCLWLTSPWLGELGEQGQIRRWGGPQERTISVHSWVSGAGENPAAWLITNFTPPAPASLAAHALSTCPEPLPVPRQAEARGLGPQHILPFPTGHSAWRSLKRAENLQPWKKLFLVF